MYKREEDLRFISVYIEAVINAPLMHLFAVLGEVELFTSWVPITAESKIIASLTHLRKLGYFLNNFPWPMYRRETFL